MIYLANLGGPGIAPNGQTAKSRQLALALERMIGADNLCVINVGLSRLNVLKLVSNFRSHALILITLGRNGVLVASLLCRILEVLSGGGKRLIYIAPGGWLAELVESNSLVRCLIRSFDSVLVESCELADRLSLLGIKAGVIRNFRDMEPQEPKLPHSDSLVKLCFCSRVQRDKGVFCAMELVSQLNAQGMNARLDIYGPIAEADRREFLSRLDRESHAEYCGQFNSEYESVKILRQYDWLLLPTSYPGECIPGVIIEAFFAGTPVLATCWKFLPEVVVEGRTGYLFPHSQYISKSIRIIEQCSREPESYLALSRHCVIDAVKSKTSEYLPELAQLLLRD